MKVLVIPRTPVNGRGEWLQFHGGLHLAERPPSTLVSLTLGVYKEVVQFEILSHHALALDGQVTGPVTRAKVLTKNAFQFPDMALPNIVFLLGSAQAGIVRRRDFPQSHLGIVVPGQHLYVCFIVPTGETDAEGNPRYFVYDPYVTAPIEEVSLFAIMHALA